MQHPRRSAHPLRAWARRLRRFALLGLAASSAFATDLSYHVSATQRLAGETRWDYLTGDASRHRLYVTHGDRVDVLDTRLKRVVGSIANTQGVHGVALAPDLGRGFTSNGRGGSVSVFDLETLHVVATVNTRSKPDAIVYDATTHRVFVGNGDSASMTVIDARTSQIIGTIALGGRPESEVTDHSGHVYINLEDKSQLLVIDSQSLAIIHRFELGAVCDEPAGLSMDVSTKRLFVGCHNQRMAIVDGDNGAIIAAVPIGAGNDATGYDPDAGLAFAANRDGTLTVVGEVDHHYLVRQTVATRLGARTLAVDPMTHNVYLVTAEIERASARLGSDEDHHPQFVPGTFTLLTVSP